MIDGHWLAIRDGDPRAADIFSRHYSKYHYRDGRKSMRICGPGQHMVLMTVDCRALWVWRKFMMPSKDGQVGVCCSVFRNEGEVLSSLLIREACELAEARWPGERQYTYIAPTKIRSTNPGYCFKLCGFKTCGITKVNKLVVLERFPP